MWDKKGVATVGLELLSLNLYVLGLKKKKFLKSKKKKERKKEKERKATEVK